ncbi:MAG: GxxExxY protein [Bacteroidaceae bacterium]|nr:GxxExxY protein [Bacteroidaceae bacterium]
MTYNVSKLADIDPALATELKNRCYPIVGLCQQVHREMGPFLNEYMYQEALDISLEENSIERVKEYYFSVSYHGRQIKHKHYVDFLVNNDVLIECKAVDRLGTEQRQQLWNYMRLTNVCMGILYNFAPVRDQCERYYLDTKTGNMYMF